jgi:hypothetical protein
MTLLLTDVGGDGLFDILGKYFHVIDVLNTARLTTIPEEVVDAIAQYKNLTTTLAYDAAVVGLPQSTMDWQDGGAVLAQQVRTNSHSLLIEMVKADLDVTTVTLTDALTELIDQMESSDSYVDPNVVTISAAALDGNTGDAVLMTSLKRGDGRDEENAYAETIKVLCISASITNPTFQFTGKPAVSDKLSQAWPAGGGSTVTVTATHASNSLLSNGDFEDATIANVPDQWLVRTGTPGYTVEVVGPEVQAVVITGTPTGGYYLLLYTDSTGVKRSTATLAYNAAGSTVQAALRVLPGLERVTVASSGTSPNFTHVITFTGTAGALTILAAVNGTVGGSISVSRISTGEECAYVGRVLKITGQGSEQTALYHPVTLSVETPYFLHWWMRRLEGEEASSSSSSSSSSSCSCSSGSSSSSLSSSSSSCSNSSSSSSSTSSQSSSSCSNSSSSCSNSSSSCSESSSSSSSSESSSSSSSESSSSSSLSSGSSSSSCSSSQSGVSSSSCSSSSESGMPMVRVAVVDGIDGSPIHDNEGVEAELRVLNTDLSSSAHTQHGFSFRLPAGCQMPVYVRILVSHPFPSDTSVFIDEMALVAGTQLYAGGPWVALFTGATPSALEDGWTITVTNNRGGSFQTMFNRVFDTVEKRLLLPSSGTTNIPDALIG